MKFYSTNNRVRLYALSEAVMKGLADDGGLFMPAEIPSAGDDFIRDIESISLHEIAVHIGKQLLGEDVPGKVLRDIVETALNFEIPLYQLKDDVYALELFHGPTLAFKDVGARFMAGLLSYFNRNEDAPLTILAATSGDTGSAVANAFLKTQGIRVVILYPGGKISDIQEKQITTLGHNIQAIEIQGSFDDCQAMAKQAFADPDLSNKLRLTSANSINIGRLIPQSFYYFHAYAQLKHKDFPLIFSVPSGNFGNITAGLIAKKMGLPVAGMVAATNINDVVPDYLDSGVYKPRKMKMTISNAMDVGDPSNFHRILDLYGSQYEKIVRDVHGVSFTDSQTRAVIADVYNKDAYILDPHGAVGYLGLRDYFSGMTSKMSGIFLGTAHPAKFRDIVEKEIGTSIEMPGKLGKYLTRDKSSISCPNSFSDMKEILYAIE